MGEKGAFNSKIEDLDLIITAGEGEKVDFKRSPNKDIASDVCAFVNATGGRIFIGIDDDGKIIGTDTSNAARSKILDTIHNIDPRPEVTLEVCDNLIMVTVPEGTDNRTCVQTASIFAWVPIHKN